MTNMGKKSKALETVDSFRDEFESSREWKLRKKFLEANLDILSKDRLICLSKCFINSAMYGCSYPKEVMTEIKSRSGGLLEHHQQETKVQKLTSAKHVYASAFVKASDDSPGSSPWIHQQGVSNAMPSAPSKRTSYESHDKMSSCQPHTSAGSHGSFAPPFKQTAWESCYKPSAVEVVDTVDYQGEGDEFVAEADSGPSPSIKSGVSPAEPVLSLEQYRYLWTRETDITLKELRLIACKAFESKEKLAMVKVLHCINKKLKLEVRHELDKELAKEMGTRFAARITFDDILAATGAAGTKVQAKRDGFEVALQKLYMPYLRISLTQCGQKELEASREPFPGARCKRPYPKRSMNHSSARDGGGVSLPTNSEPGLGPPPAKLSRTTLQDQGEETSEDWDFSEGPLITTESNFSTVAQKYHAGNRPLDSFIIVERGQAHVNSRRETNTLRESADFSGMILESEVTVSAPARVSCVIRLGGQVVGEAQDVSKKEARLQASVKALEYLRPLCWTLKYKGTTETETISKEELFTEIQQRTEAIGESNIGNKMLRKMGWSGGGVGKHGAGIVEPVAAQGVIGRAGLGLSSSMAAGGVLDERVFRVRVRDALKNYIQSGEQEDLKFEADFSKEERKIIHLEAKKFKLRTVSRGSGESRYLTLSHKRSAHQLLQHVSESGGETKSYILLPPGSYQSQVSESDDVS